MAQSEVKFSSPVQCGHCGNVAPMSILSTYSSVVEQEDLGAGCRYRAGDIYEMLRCPACDQVTLRKYYWSDFMESEADITFKTLYPQNTRMPLGLPVAIKTAYTAALKVKLIDSNGFGVLLGRVLDLICADRNACGERLVDKLADLARRNEIPGKLADAAHTLRKLRNVGAHADLGELTPEEVPILEDLCCAILEYVYTAPYLAQLAENTIIGVTKRYQAGF